MTEYIDDRGKTVMVSQGIGELWMTCRVKKSGSLQRVKSKFLPERDTQKEAQADLDQYANAMGWKKCPPTNPLQRGTARTTNPLQRGTVEAKYQK